MDHVPLPWVGLQPGDEVRSYPGLVPLLAKPLHPVGEGSELFLELWIEAGPVSAVLFRPEEVHTRSTETAGFGSRVLSRTAELAVGVAHDTFRFG